MQNNSINSQTDIANVTVVTEENQIIVPQPITSVIEVNNPGPQGPVGPQGVAGPSEPFANMGGGVYATTSSIQVTGSFLVSGSSTFTNIGPAIFSGSVDVVGATTMSSAIVTGNVTVLGTASIGTLVVNQTVLSTGSNQLGDSANDTQTLYGTVVVPTGSLTITGSLTVSSSNATQLLVGSNLLFVSSSGNVGIGTITPTNTLDVSGTVRLLSGGSYLTLNNSTYSELAYTAVNYFRANGAQALINGPTIQFLVGGSEKVRVASTTGNFLINTTTDAGFKLDVNGNAKIKGSGATSATTALRVENTNASASLVVLDNGFVGIGTSSAQYNLDLYGSYHQYQNQGLLARYDISSANANQNRGVWDFYTNAASSADFFGRFGFKFEGGTSDAFKQFQVHIGDSTTPKFVVDGSGRMGIGTIAPSAQLHVSGSSGSALLRIDSPASSSILFVSGSGNVGINTTGSSAYSLDINGTARVNGPMVFAQNSQINGSGNLSIGAFSIHSSFGYATFSQTTLLLTGATFTSTTGTQTGLSFSGGFSPTSGTATYSAYSILPTINQTGGANGITRGLFISPTLTSAADYRAIETTSGSVIFNQGTASLMLVSSSGNVGIGTNNPSANIHIANSSSAAIRIQNVGGSSADFSISAGNGRLEMVGNGASAGRITVGQFAKTVGINQQSPNAALDVIGSGATNATNTFLVRNSTPTTLLTMLDNGQVAFTSPTMSLAVSQSAFSISPIISASNIVGGQYYGVSITPTFFQTTGSQTETAFRVAATFTSSNAATATGGNNVIADFGSTSAGSQLTVTDVTSGSIYMVNDVSGIPIIEATSNWDVNIYDFPNKVFEKTGSQVNIYGTMRISGSFILPLSQSVAPQTGSAYWSGSLLFIYDGTRYRSSSFA